MLVFTFLMHVAVLFLLILCVFLSDFFVRFGNDPSLVASFGILGFFGCKLVALKEDMPAIKIGLRNCFSIKINRKKDSSLI